MQKHNNRGVIHVLLLATLILVALSLMARCDIDNTQHDELTNPMENRDAMDTDLRWYGHDLGWSGDDQLGL